MKHAEKMSDLLKQYCVGKKATIKTTTELDKKIVRDALLAQSQFQTIPSAATQPMIRRLIMQSKSNKVIAAAIILLLIVVILAEFNKTNSGFSTVYAAALDHVRQAGTFSCIKVFQSSYEKDGKEGAYLLKQKVMFKELMPARVLQQCLKSWPARQKKVAVYMAYLYGYCQQYAQAHQGRYPDTLEDLVHGDLTRERIQGFQTAWGQCEGTIKIYYRQPQPESDPTQEVILYEASEQDTDGKTVVTFADGRCEAVADRSQYDHLTR